MTTWQPMGKFVLVRLHTRGSALELAGDVKYDSLATVLAVGPGRVSEDGELAVGDVVLLGGNQGLIGHTALGEHIALVAGPLVLARRVEQERES